MGCMFYGKKMYIIFAVLIIITEMTVQVNFWF